MVDWQLAGKIAEGVAALQPSGDAEPFRALVRPADESERLVSEYTGLKPLAGALPVAEAVSRDEWIKANLESMRDVIEPAAERAAGKLGGTLGGIAGGAAGAVLAIEAGAISGFLAGRVLGQYEFPVLDPEAPARLLFVAPNLGHAATQLEAEPDPLLVGRHAVRFMRASMRCSTRQLNAAAAAATSQMPTRRRQRDAPVGQARRREQHADHRTEHDQLDHPRLGQRVVRAHPRRQRRTGGATLDDGIGHGTRARLHSTKQAAPRRRQGGPPARSRAAAAPAAATTSG